MKTIYLAGPINGCSDTEAKDWRARVKQELAGKYEFLDPMARDYRGKEAESVDDIVRGDMNDIQCCHVILAYTPKPSVGTSMEIFYAKHVLGKRVLTVCESERPSPWLVYFSTSVFRTIEEVIAELAQ